jgi:hypothetical protein
LCGQYGTSFRNCPVQNRGERVWLPTYGVGPKIATSKTSAIWAQKSQDFQAPPLPMAQVMDLLTSKSLSTSAIKNRYIDNFMFMSFCVLCFVFCILYSNGPPSPSCMGGGEEVWKPVHKVTLHTRNPSPYSSGTKSNFAYSLGGPPPPPPPPRPTTQKYKNKKS